jgi:uncharacterized membrane protein
MAVVLGALVAIAFGWGDYLGARSSTKASTIGVLCISQPCGAALGLALALAVSATVTGHDLVFGACAGVANVVGLGLLYHALARYAIGVAAPVAAVMGALVPVVWGLLDGERPSTVTAIGAVVAIGAGALLAREPVASGPGLAAGALVAGVAGSALGASLVLYSETSADSGMWPVFAARTTAAVCVLALAGGLLLAGRAPVIPRDQARLLALLAGVLDVTASALLLAAVRRGLMVVVAPLAALAPGFTVVLAWRFLGEHLGRPQRIGLVLALAGIVLVAAG